MTKDLTEAEFQAKKTELEALAEHTKQSVDSGLLTPEQAVGFWCLQLADLID